MCDLPDSLKKNVFPSRRLNESEKRLRAKQSMSEYRGTAKLPIEIEVIVLNPYLVKYALLLIAVPYFYLNAVKKVLDLSVL